MKYKFYLCFYIECDFKCSLCEKSAENCLECVNKLRDPGNKCHCDIGFYENGTECECNIIKN